MGLSDLPTLQDRPRCAEQKSAITSRLTEKSAKQTTDDRELEQWKKSVRTRDRMRCRACGRKVTVKLALHPDRAECHHLVGRKDKALRTDRRNGLLVCATCHEDLTRHKLTPLAKASQMFELNGKRYINADEPITFQRTK